VTPLLDHPPAVVLEHFAPHTRDLTWRRAPDGFSGARVWCGAEGAPSVALKAWPPDTAPDRVRQIHVWLARAAHLAFVPTVFSGIGGITVVVEANRVWDCCRWMPGQPCLEPRATDVAAACEAVARLHAAWGGSPRSGPCPGVANRLRILAENEALLSAGPNALPPVSPLLDPLLRRAGAVAARAGPRAVRELRAYSHHAFTLHPCVRDLRGAHVLFEAEWVSGIIDYGAAAIDHPAVDLARLLSDFAGENAALFEAGLNAYRGARGQFDAPDAFVHLLAHTGDVCSLLGWLVRLVVWRESPDPVAVAGRLGRLLARVEHFAQI
jgi:homoserine kinase type II